MIRTVGVKVASEVAAAAALGFVVLIVPLLLLGYWTLLVVGFGGPLLLSVMLLFSVTMAPGLPAWAAAALLRRRRADHGDVRPLVVCLGATIAVYGLARWLGGPVVAGIQWPINQLSRALLRGSVSPFIALSGLLAAMSAGAFVGALVSPLVPDLPAPKGSSSMLAAALFFVALLLWVLILV